MKTTTKKLKSNSTTAKAESTKAALPKPEPAKTIAAKTTRTNDVKAESPARLERPRAEHKTNQIVLELVKPGAKSVCVAGSFNQWKPEDMPLEPKGNDRWVGDLAVRPGRHEYLFVVDGQWVPDPNAKETVANPFGGRNSVLIVSE